MTIKQSTYALLFLLSFSVPMPHASAQYVTEAQKRADEQAARKEAERNHYMKLVGGTYWFQPHKMMNAAFYSKYVVYPRGSLGVSIEDKFMPVETVSFVIEEFLFDRFNNVGRPTHIYKVRLQDGKVAFMKTDDFGSFNPDYPGYHYLTDGENERDLLWNDKILTRSPEDIRARREERARIKAEAEETARREVLAEKEKVEREFQRRLVALKAEAAANKRKGGVRIGMTSKQVLNSSWGRPSDINRTTTAHGVSEQWVYNGSSYLYFTNGKLTAIQN